MTSDTQPESGTTSYSYDSFGRLGTKTDALGQQTTYGYDLMNRLTSVTAPDPTYSATVGYDPSSGTRTSVSNGYVSSTFQFDADNRMTGRTDVIAGHTFQTSYDNRTFLFVGLHVAAAVALRGGRDAIAAFLPGPGWIYAGVALTYDAATIARAWVNCRED